MSDLYFTGIRFAYDFVQMYFKNAYADKNASALQSHTWCSVHFHGLLALR